MFKYSQINRLILFCFCFVLLVFVFFFFFFFFCFVFCFCFVLFFNFIFSVLVVFCCNLLVCLFVCLFLRCEFPLLHNSTYFKSTSDNHLLINNHLRWILHSLSFTPSLISTFQHEFGMTNVWSHYSYVLQVFKVEVSIASFSMSIAQNASKWL